MEVGEHAAFALLDHERGATGLRTPITTLPTAFVRRRCEADAVRAVACSLRSRAVAASISAFAAATVWASTSVRMVASISPAPTR